MPLPCASPRSSLPIRWSAWYGKSLPSFADARALVRRDPWARTTFPALLADADLVKLPHAFVDHLRNLLRYTA